MSKLLISTHCDLDAIGVVVLSRYVSEKLKEVYDDYEIWFNDYTDYDKGVYPYERLKEFSEIWYFDFTPNEKARNIIKENMLPCTIGDHHEGIKNEIDTWDYSKKQYVFNNEQSGAKIYYNFLLSNSVIKETPILTEFIERVSVYDLYSKKDPLWVEAQNLNRLLYKCVTWSKKGQQELNHLYHLWVYLHYKLFQYQGLYLRI